jgi:hypothetical protein
MPRARPFGPARTRRLITDPGGTFHIPLGSSAASSRTNNSTELRESLVLMRRICVSEYGFLSCARLLVWMRSAIRSASLPVVGRPRRGASLKPRVWRRSKKTSPSLRWQRREGLGRSFGAEAGYLERTLWRRLEPSQRGGFNQSH